MKYRILGDTLPVVEVELEAREQIKCEAGAMSWMTPNIAMETAGGGLGKVFSRMVSGERLFQNTYTCTGGTGTIAFASSFPGNIVAVEITPDKEVICQKSAYLASTARVELSIFFQRKLGSGLVGGEGFIMQRLSGHGLAFLEIDGSAVEKTLGSGEQLIIDTGYLAMMDGTCSMDVQTISGVRNVLLGGEGLFNTVVTGPGKVVLQTMPIYQTAMSLLPYIPRNSN